MRPTQYVESEELPVLSRRAVTCCALPWLGFALVDAILLWRFGPGSVRGYAEALVHLLCHGIGVGAFLFALAKFVASARSPSWRAAGFVVAYFAFDLSFAATAFTGHFAYGLVRASVGVFVVAFAAFVALRPALVVRAAGLIPAAALIVTASTVALGLAFGFSLTRFTTKHFAEAGHAMLLYPVALLWLGTAVSHRTRSGTLRVLVMCVLCLCGSAAAAGSLSEDSTYRAVTLQTGTPALRRLHRFVARHLASPGCAPGKAWMRRKP